MRTLATLGALTTSAFLLAVPTQEPPPEEGFLHEKHYLHVLELPVAQRTQFATEVVHARVLGSSQSFPTDQPAYTEYALEVLFALKGVAPVPSSVRVPGARNESIWVEFPQAPRFETGEELVLFLHPTSDGGYILLGLGAGMRRVVVESDGSRTVHHPDGNTTPLGAFLEFLLSAWAEAPAPVF